MPSRNTEIKRLLQSKYGFRSATKEHVWIELKLPDMRPVRTCISHSRQTLGQDLEHKMARQLLVTISYFREMIGCTKSCEDYYSHLRSLS